jgi:hypothetical protein
MHHMAGETLHEMIAQGTIVGGQIKTNCRIRRYRRTHFPFESLWRTHTLTFHVVRSPNMYPHGVCAHALAQRVDPLSKR